MPIRCAWCGRQIGDDTRLTAESHGICASCQQVKFPDSANPAAEATPGQQSSGNDEKR
jgi:hypothetical protein